MLGYRQTNLDKAMRPICQFLTMIILTTAVPWETRTSNKTAALAKIHSTTDWRIQPSFTLDTDCLLNVLAFMLPRLLTIKHNNLLKLCPACVYAIDFRRQRLSVA